MTDETKWWWHDASNQDEGQKVLVKIARGLEGLFLFSSWFCTALALLIVTLLICLPIAVGFDGTDHRYSTYYWPVVFAAFAVELLSLLFFGHRRTRIFRLICFWVILASTTISTLPFSLIVWGVWLLFYFVPKTFIKHQILHEGFVRGYLISGGGTAAIERYKELTGKKVPLSWIQQAETLLAIRERDKAKHVGRRETPFEQALDEAEQQ
jgi:hypothetical protein